MENKIKINGYGGLLSYHTKLPLISFTEFGSYQGEWIAVLDAGENIELWKGYYGSCSGCDSLQSVQQTHYDSDNYNSYIPKEWADKYFKEDRPFVVITKETFLHVDSDTFIQMLPANIRSGIYDFDGEKLYNDINKSIN